MISAAHMLARARGHVPSENFLKKNATWCVLMFLCILYKLLGPPRQVPSHAICGTILRSVS